MASITWTTNSPAAVVGQGSNGVYGAAAYTLGDGENWGSATMTANRGTESHSTTMRRDNPNQGVCDGTINSLATGTWDVQASLTFSHPPPPKGQGGMGVVSTTSVNVNVP